MRVMVLQLSSLYWDAIRIALVQQIVCAILCMLLLDGGRMARICAAAMLGFSVGVALVMARRPQAPTALDLRFIRWGFVPLFFAGAAWASLM